MFVCVCVFCVPYLAVIIEIITYKKGAYCHSQFLVCPINAPIPTIPYKGRRCDDDHTVKCSMFCLKHSGCNYLILVPEKHTVKQNYMLPQYYNLISQYIL